MHSKELEKEDVVLEFNIGALHICGIFVRCILLFRDWNIEYAIDYRSFATTTDGNFYITPARHQLMALGCY